MQTDDFNFELPGSLIAQRPVRPRDSARLLEVRGDGTLGNNLISDLPNLLNPQDLIVFNDTRVFPARLYGRCADVNVEVLLCKIRDLKRCEALVRPSKKLHKGDCVEFAKDFAAEVVEKNQGGTVVFKFPYSESDFFSFLNLYGSTPIPRYITKKRSADTFDQHDYQTIFSAKVGSIAAPTAGLHFTKSLITKLNFRGVRQCSITLHVGLGTFLPVRTERVEDHVMHAEWGTITDEVVDAIADTRSRGGRIVAIGTTSLRLLETAATDSGNVTPFTGETSLFILPGYQFRVVDLLLTNFHLPRSTLFMLGCAFVGTNNMYKAYSYAMKNSFRFYSYGDASLLVRV